MRQTMRCFRTLFFLFIFSQTLHAATYVLFLQHHGLNLLEANLVNMSFFVTLFVCEIPTGVFADVFGRKPSFILACVLWAVGLGVYGLSTTMTGFIGAELVLAVGATFFSGAFDAWYVDSIIHHGQEEELQRFMIHKSQIENFAAIAGILVGGSIADYNLAYPWLLGSIVMLGVSIAAVFWMREDYAKPKIKSGPRPGFAQMKQVARSGVDYGLKNRTVRFLVIIGAIQFFAMQPVNMFWAPYFQTYAGSFTAVAGIRVGMQATMILGSALAMRFAASFADYRMALLVAQALIGITVMVSGLAGFRVSIGFFLMHEVSRGIFGPIKNKHLHASIPSAQRATISSLESLVHHFGGALGLLLGGIAGNAYGIRFSWLLFGFVLLISSIMFMKKK